MQSPFASAGEWQDLVNKYYRIGKVAEKTLQVLAQFVDDVRPAPDRPRGSGSALAAPSSRVGAQDRDEAESVLSAALEHLAEVREGFQLQFRAAEINNLPEMSYLLERALVDWRWLEQLGWELEKTAGIELPRGQLMAFAHAHVALAALPRLPRHRVTFPQRRRTYADIPVPTPGLQVLLRLEELDAVIYRVLGKARDRVEREPLRRTYGFFESTAWLVSDHHKKFAAPRVSD